MIEERYESLMRDAARTYNSPPDDVPFNEMWASIQQRRVREDALLDRALEARAAPAVPVASRGSVRRWRPWAQIAAALILGAVLGRGSTLVGTGEARSVAPRVGARGDATAYHRPVTDEYLGDAAALLIALPAALESERVDPSIAWRASDLLLQTRLLLDSPELSDPALRALFEDLEVVLVQVVRLGDWDPMKVDLLEQSLERQKVIPRLRSVVVNHFTD